MYSQESVNNDKGTPIETIFNRSGLYTPSISGREFNKIPFVFINPKDIDPAPEEPPLLDLSELALTIYRGEADYRQALFMQGQDTLVVKGAEQDGEYTIGAESVITLVNPEADAKFIGVDSRGIEEMRLASQNDQNNAAQKGGQLLDSVSRERESGDALKIRVAAKTATLTEIALTGAFGLEEILKRGAIVLGANPDEVSVTPNLDFIDDTVTGQEILAQMQAKHTGAPISSEVDP